MKTKKVYASATQDHLTENPQKKVLSYIPSFPSFFNLVYNLGSKNRLKPQEFLADSIFSEDGTMEIKGNPEITLDQIKKKLNGTTQELFLYLTNKALELGYKDFITIQVDKFFDTRDIQRQAKNVNKMIEDLNILANTFFALETVYYEKKERKRKTNPLVQLLSYTLEYVGEKEGKLQSIEIAFGPWMRRLKEVDQATKKSEYKVIPFPNEVFKIDQMKYPTATAYGLKMLERWRFNQQNRSNAKKDSEVIRLTTLLEASGEIESFPKQAKKRGLVGTRGVLEKLEKNLTIMEEAFGIQWEWEKELTSISQLNEATITYRPTWWESKKKEKSAK